jgi:acetyl esterase/lipase
MLRWILLALVLALAALSLLTVVKAPDWAPWKLAVLAGEFGHWLVPLPLLVVAIAWLSRGSQPIIALATVGVGAVATGLFLKPTIEASLMAQTLPGKLERAFGRATLARAPFTVSDWWRGRPEPVAMKTLTYSADLALDFYPAVRVDGSPAPCVLLVHGGGWDGGERTEIAHFNHWLARRGYAVAAITYRLAPKFPWPAQRDDVHAAIAFLRQRAGELRVDVTRLVLLGRSAGGQIAEAVGYAAREPAIRGVIAFYAPADMHFAYTYSREDDIIKSPMLLRQFLGGPPDAARANYDSASGYLQVNPAVPPTLLIHGPLDTLVWHRQSERLAARLAEQRVPHAFVSLPWATHALEYNLHGPGGQLATFAVEWFLAVVTK